MLPQVEEPLLVQESERPFQTGVSAVEFVQNDHHLFGCDHGCIIARTGVSSSQDNGVAGAPSFSVTQRTSSPLLTSAKQEAGIMESKPDRMSLLGQKWLEPLRNWLVQLHEFSALKDCGQAIWSS